MTAPSDTGGGHVLVVNAGSSSVKLAVLDPVSGRRALTGLAERVGTGEASVVVKGDRVEVTSGKTFVGTVVARYRVLDATGDADRAVEGRIRITVQGRPEAPGKPVVSSVQSRTVVLSWTPPSDNGAPITGYTVT